MTVAEMCPCIGDKVIEKMHIKKSEMKWAVHYWKSKSIINVPRSQAKDSKKHFLHHDTGGLLCDCIWSSKHQHADAVYKYSSDVARNSHRDEQSSFDNNDESEFESI